MRIEDVAKYLSSGRVIDLSKKEKRFLFFGFPAKMGGLESFPIRAVAIEGVE